MKMNGSQFRVDHLPPYQLGSIAARVNELRLSGQEVIDLSQINPELSPPQPALDKLVQGILLPHNHRYSSSQGILKLREAVVEFYQKRFGVSLQVDSEVAGTLGTKEALSHLLLAILSPGDHVVLPTPCYPIHRSGVFLAGGSSVGVPLFDDFDTALSEQFRLTGESERFFERLAIAFESSWPQPRVIILNFPHNPTGSWADRSFLERIVKFSLERGVILLNDFAYGELHYGQERPVSLLEIPGAIECAVEFFSLSKLYSMPGWRVGFAAGNSRLIGALKKVKSYLDFGAFQPLQIACAFSLNRDDLNLDEVRATYQSRSSVLSAGLLELGFELKQPPGGMLLWARIPKAHRGRGSIAFSHHLLEEAHVATSPGAGFDPLTDDTLRFSLGESEARMRKAVQQMKRCL